ncbi:MAG: InlB B-repeat-containing protein [Eubacterium sp.]
MDRTFAPNAVGNATNIGKLIFGKKADGETSQEWYILGKDEGVTGDNTIIFASDPMGTKSKFNSDTSEKKYNYSAGTGYGESDGSIDVYANHYGASVLRAALQGMETGNFTTSEQDLMNATTVTTTDLKNSVSYTTTDKLYALASGGDTTIKAGSSDQIVLSMSQYWNSNGELFSLRSPRAEQSTHVLLVRSGERVVYTDVKSPFTVRPASNLNLSSVLFASAAQAASSGTSASGTIKAGTAMTLRLDGSNKNIGVLAYNTDSGEIKATKGSTTGNVALVVQGNDGTDDWYFSKQITGTETVNVSEMKTSLGISADIDLSKCEIWLETTDNGMSYAVTVHRCSTEEELRKFFNSEGALIMLTGDITLSDTLNLNNKNMILDLNGHVITMTGSGSVLRVNSNCSLTLQDSRPDAAHTEENASLPVGGVITGGNAPSEGGGGVQICSNATFTMNGGSISSCSANGAGNGVFNKGSFTMNGGKIDDGVYNENWSTTAMRANGGEITGLSNCDAGLCIEKDEDKNGTTFYGDVVNRLSTINAGTYKGTVTNYQGSSDTIPGTISGGIFEGTVINRDGGVISGGIFYGGIENEDTGTVTGTYYTVSFDLNGASGTVPTQWFVNADNAKVRQPENPVWEGYVFLGWYNGDAKYDFTKPVTENISLTAKWVSENVSSETELKEALAQGSNFIRLAADFNLTSILNLSDKIITLDLNGHTLEGDIKLADNAAAPKTILTLIDSNPAAGGVLKGKVTLTRGSGYESRLNANGGTITGMVSLPSYAGKIYCTSDTPTAFKGLVGNYGEIHGGIFYGSINTGCIKEKTITFKVGSSTYAYEVVGSCSNTVAPVSPSSSLAANAGYEDFDCWYNGEAEYEFGSSLSENITLTAKFRNPKTYTIAYNLGEGTVAEENPTSYNVESENITLNNPEKEGYTFIGWSGTGLTGNNNMSVTIPKGSTGNRTYTAHFCQHQWVDKPAKKASLTEAGYTAYRECSVCNGTEGKTEIPQIDESSIAFDETTFIYDGEAKTPAVTIRDMAGNALSKDTDYTLEYSNNVKAGTAAVTITFTGSYDGAVEKQFEIVCNHAKAVKHEAVAATCTGDGNTEYWQCPDCDKYFASKPDKDSDPIAAGSWIVGAKGHSAGKTEVVKATTTANGVVNQKCTECGKILSGKTIYKVSNISLATTSYTYSGGVKTPSVRVKDSTGKTLDTKSYSVTYASGRKNVGVYKVTVTLKGNYQGSKVLTFKINPKGTSLSTLSGAKKAFTVSWKKQSAKMAASRITGYQIRYSTSSKMTSAKTITVKGYKYTSKKISNLKAKKKYYVQIRTYKTVSGKNYYSSWSTAKTVKTK